MSFDFAVGINQQGLNSAAAQIYAANSTFLNGSTTGTSNGQTCNMAWSLTGPPTFDLTLRQPDTGPIFNLDIATSLTITGGLSTTLPVTFTVNCAASVNNGVATFSVTGISASPITGNPLANTLITTSVMPQVQAMASGFLQSVSIPSIAIDGVTLSPPAIAIVPIAGTETTPALIAVASAFSSTPPSPPRHFPYWPSSDFFAVIFENLFLKMVKAQFSQNQSSLDFSGGGGSISDGFGNVYSYAFGVQDATVTLNLASEPTIGLGITVEGGFSDKFEAFWAPTTVGFTVSSSPSPIPVTLAFSTSGDSLAVTSTGAPSFTLTQTAQGNALEKILDYIVEKVIDPTLAAAQTVLAAMLGAIEATIPIPSVSVSIDGTDYTASPSELVIGSFDPNRNNAVLFTGSLTVTSAPSVLALAASLRRSRRSAFSTSVSD